MPTAVSMVQNTCWRKVETSWSDFSEFFSECHFLLLYEDEGVSAFKKPNVYIEHLIKLDRNTVANPQRTMSRLFF